MLRPSPMCLVVRETAPLLERTADTGAGRACVYVKSVIIHLRRALHWSHSSTSRVKSLISPGCAICTHHACERCTRMLVMADLAHKSWLISLDRDVWSTSTRCQRWIG